MSADVIDTSLVVIKVGRIVFYMLDDKIYQKILKRSTEQNRHDRKDVTNMATKKTKETPVRDKTKKTSARTKQGLGDLDKVKKTSGAPAKKKDGRGGFRENAGLRPSNYLKTKPGDTTEIVNMLRELTFLPNIDLNDVDQVIDRLNEYFEIFAKYDQKPTVSGMAMALNGKSRQWLWSVVNGAPVGGSGYTIKLRPEVADVIKKIYHSLEVSMEAYMVGNKINPVTGIFLSKNHFGYRDQTEHVVVSGEEKTVNPDEIRARYVNSETPRQLSDSSTPDDSDS